LKRIHKTLEKVNELLDNDIAESEYDAYFSGLLDEYRTKFLESMDNDFNTPEALAHIFNFVKELNKAFEDKAPSEKVLKDIISFFNEFGEMKLREKKEWELSDDIRGRLTDLGIDIED